ncbi:hypothetical protein B7463_g10026, partial [Scytalidium lignicola]
MASWTPINRPRSPTPASGSSSASSIPAVVTAPSTPAPSTPTPPGPAAALPALPTLPAHPTGAMRALAILPPLQESTVREGRTLNTNRPANMEALLGFLVGRVNGQPCTHCANGSGMWTEYVSVPGHFNRACTNCHYNSKGSRCSFHIHNHPLPAPVASATTSAIAATPAEAPAGRHHSLRPHAPPATTPSTTSCSSIAVVSLPPPPAF